VHEVVADHLASVADRDHELVDRVVREQLHDVPQDRTPTHLHHWLGPEFGLFAQSSAQATGKDHGLHRQRLYPGITDAPGSARAVAGRARDLAPANRYAMMPGHASSGPAPRARSRV